MAANKIARLVTSLVNRTERGELSWEPTSEDGVFMAAFPDYSLTIDALARDFGNDPIYRISIYNKTGALIDTMSTEDDLGIPNQYPVLKNLYDTARRTAMGIEQALDSIIDALDDDDDNRPS